MLRKGEGVGGGAKPSVEKEKSIGYEVSQSPTKTVLSPKQIVD